MKSNPITEPTLTSPSAPSPMAVPAPTGSAAGRNVRTISATVIILAAMLLASYFLKRLLNVPGQIVGKVPVAIDATSAAMSRAGDRAAESLKRLAQAINSQTIKTDYTSTGTTLAGTQYLQVGRIDQVELFEQRDHATRWGIQMPDLVVSARAPVEYTYYLDLMDHWSFSFDGKRVHVITPALRFNKPSVDASAIAYRVEEDSVLRNTRAALDALKGSVTTQVERRARQNIQIVREKGRREAEQFVTRFIVQMYGVDEDTPVSVAFADEMPVRKTSIELQ